MSHKEIALGVGYTLGMLGCEEAEIEGDIQLKCYFEGEDAALQVKKRVKQIITNTPITVNKIENQDWNAKWRESMEPVLVAEHIWVSPAWLPPTMQKGDQWIIIEPKMAFGTGHHETTRLAAHALVNSDISFKESPKLLDIGTGSGILCFIGEYTGYYISLGIEIDRDCAGNLIENLRDNSVKSRISFIIGTCETLKRNALFDTIVMNMLRTESEPLLDICKQLLKPDGVLIWSGILCEERENVITHAGSHGLKLMHEAVENEWWCGVFV